MQTNTEQAAVIADNTVVFMQVSDESLTPGIKELRITISSNLEESYLFELLLEDLARHHLE